MAEYMMDYDGWAEGMPIGAYLKVRDAMHERKRELDAIADAMDGGDE